MNSSNHHMLEKEKDSVTRHWECDTEASSLVYLIQEVRINHSNQSEINNRTSIIKAMTNTRDET